MANTCFHRGGYIPYRYKNKFVGALNTEQVLTELLCAKCGRIVTVDEIAVDAEE